MKVLKFWSILNFIICITCLLITFIMEFYMYYDFENFSFFRMMKILSLNIFYSTFLYSIVILFLRYRYSYKFNALLQVIVITPIFLVFMVILLNTRFFTFQHYLVT